MPKISPFSTAIVLAACTVVALAQEAPPAAGPAETLRTLSEKNSDGEKPAEYRTEPAPAKPGSSAVLGAPEYIPTATPTPAPKKPSFFERLFGAKKHKPEATPAASHTTTPPPSSTPRKVIVRRVSATPTPVPESVATPKPGKSPKATPVAKATPEPAKSTPVPGKSTPAPKATPTAKVTLPAKATPVPKTEKPEKTEKPVATPAPKPEKPIVTATPAPTTPAPVKKNSKTKNAPAETVKPAANEPPADADPEEKEKFHFEQAKAKAIQDPQIVALKAKADDATTDEESRKALRAYNKALFEKIRKIDSSVSERAERLEAAMMKRLSE